jgi:hypothetical protein
MEQCAAWGVPIEASCSNSVTAALVNGVRIAMKAQQLQIAVETETKFDSRKCATLLQASDRPFLNP